MWVRFPEIFFEEKISGLVFDVVLSLIVSFPDPDPHAGKGLVTFAHFVGCARSAIA